jgi:hypothetical protein
MATQRKLKGLAKLSLIATIILLVWILWPLLAGCEPIDAQAAVEQALPQRTQVVIKDVEKVTIKAYGRELSFFKFSYDGHEYYMVLSNSCPLYHSPNCGCQEKSGLIPSTNSLFDSFDW